LTEQRMAETNKNPIYRVARWAETFETSESRKLKTLSWVALPVDLQSNGFQLMVETFGDEAPTMYGAWCALIAVAAKCPVRGTLAAQKGAGYTAARIARLTHFPESVHERLIEWALSEPVGWLEVASSPGNLPERRENSVSTGQDRTGQDIPTTVGGGVVLDEEIYSTILHFVQGVASAFKATRPTAQDARMILVATALAHEQRLPAGSLGNIVAQIAESREVQKPFAVLRKRLNELCESQGFEFQQVLTLTKVDKAFLKLQPLEPVTA
jgi:hypothetical protein